MVVAAGARVWSDGPGMQVHHGNRVEDRATLRQHIRRQTGIYKPEAEPASIWGATLKLFRAINGSIYDSQSNLDDTALVAEGFE